MKDTLKTIGAFMITYGLMIVGAVIGTLKVFTRLLSWYQARKARPSTEALPQVDGADYEVTKARKELERIRLVSSIFETTDADHIDGYHVEPLGWVSSERLERSSAEYALRDEAARLHPDANVLIKLTSTTASERYVAGVGAKGNAYYRNRRKTTWEALAGHATPLSEVDRPARRWRSDLAIVDGSNVMHWDDQTPKIETLQAVIDLLVARRQTPHVVFDRNAGFKLTGKPASIAKIRNLIARDVNMEYCPPSEPADISIIDLAIDLGAPIVSNDQFKDSIRARHVPKIKGFSVNGVTELLDPRP